MVVDQGLQPGDILRPDGEALDSELFERCLRCRTNLAQKFQHFYRIAGLDDRDDHGSEASQLR